MSSVTSQITLTEVCFPDITGKVQRAWGLITFSPGSYVTGGLVMGLMRFADDRTVDFNGFLRCRVWNEDVVTTLYSYHYSPVGDVLQIFDNTGAELASGSAIPALILADDTLFEASWDRTTVRG